MVECVPQLEMRGLPSASTKLSRRCAGNRADDGKTVYPQDKAGHTDGFTGHPDQSISTSPFSMAMGRKLTLMDCRHSVGCDIRYFLQLLSLLKIKSCM